jgi:putative endonuclease
MHPKYKRMIGVMLEKEKSEKKKKRKNKKNTDNLDEAWFLYILRCKDGSLYTGITKDLERRFKMHNDGKASKYTRTRRPLKLVYKETCQSHTQALVRECQIKEFSKDKKEKLTASYISL